MTRFTCEDCAKGGGSHTLECPRFGRIADALKRRLVEDEKKEAQ